MGNSVQRKVNSIKRKFGSSDEPQHKDNAIGFQFICPNCSKAFGHKSLQIQVKKHLSGCRPELEEDQQQQKVKTQKLVVSKNDKIIYSYHLDDYLYIKAPIDDTYTKFKWQKAPIKLIPPFILNMNPTQIANLSFQQKSAWFRFHLQRFRIPWMNGADFMKIQKTNVLMSSLIWSKKVNMYKQVKIQFAGDKVNDAGGLLRQWMHLVIKEMFDQSTGIFSFCSTDDAMYKLKWDEQVDQQFSQQLLILFGVILGKAIFQKIPINSYVDRTILRQLSSRQNQIQLFDIFGYDRQLYNNWTFMLENDINDMGLQTYFVINKQNSETSTVDIIELVEEGKDTPVTDQNKKMYIDLCIQTMCKQKVQRSIQFIRKGFYKVIPEQLIKVFEPYEIQMLIYGVPYIDVKDWKLNTQYKGQYHAAHKIIKWFWEVMEHFNQEQLANLLKFSTGSARTPIHGFKKLQSNRGNFSKFIIQSSQFTKHNPYPKGHTCFNRLQLPKYSSKQALNLYLTAISNSNLDGVFGLD